MNAQTAILQKDITPDGGDYETVRRVIEKISLDYRDQPSLETLAEEVGETPTGLQKLFTRWAGLSPKALPAGGHARPCAQTARPGHAAARDLFRGRHVRPRPAARPFRHP